MKRTVIAVSLVAGIGAITLFVTFCYTQAGIKLKSYWEPEPRYEGRTLSEWLARAGNIYTPGIAENPYLASMKECTAYRSFSFRETPVTSLNPEARNAIRAMGLAAIPSLLAMVDTKNGRDPKQTMLAYQRRVHGFWGFMALGPMASPAIPTLEKLSKNSDHHVAVKAVWSLGAIGPEATPVLVRALTDKDLAVGMAACEVLVPSLQTNEVVKAAFIKELDRSHPRVKVRIANALRLSSPEAASMG